MHKLLVFDLDGTLAARGKGMLTDDIELLRGLEQCGYTIAVCSGKPSFYLCGFMRQVGLVRPILIGENGATIQFGVELPPKQYYVYPYSAEAKRQIKRMRALIDEACGDDVWYQPNEVELTPFMDKREVFEKVQRLIDAERDELSEVLVYRHEDCYDFIPKNINKANGIQFLTELLNIKQADVIAVGDGVNDIPMFEYADVSVKVGNSTVYGTDYTFDSINEALVFLLKQRL